MTVIKLENLFYGVKRCMTHYQMNDRDRKILTIIQNNSKRGVYPNIDEISFRSGYEKQDVIETVKRLIAENWLKYNQGKWIVLRNLF